MNEVEVRTRLAILEEQILNEAHELADTLCKSGNTAQSYFISGIITGLDNERQFLKNCLNSLAKSQKEKK